MVRAIVPSSQSNTSQGTDLVTHFVPATSSGQPAARVGTRQIALPAASATGAVQGGLQAAFAATSHKTFTEAEKRALVESSKVLVLEYSSTGGGHTDRSLLPVKQAFANGVLKPGDSVVLLAPPRWEHDGHGGHVGKLHNRKDELTDLGLKVFLKQTDKTVTGLYEKGGASNNVAMLRDFVYKPRRGPEVNLSSKVPDDDTPWPSGSGQTARAILGDLIQAVGAKYMDKIVVMGDMAPYLQKAAKDRGIQTRVEIGNHQGLFTGEGRKALQGKDLSFLAKASSAGLPNRLALIDYNTTMNVLPTLPATFKALGIENATTKQEARDKVLKHLFDHGTRTSLVVDEKWTPGILVAENAKPSSIKAMVYLYVNDYTQGVVDHVRQKMKDEPDNFGSALFAVCGPKAFKSSCPKGADNILHVMYAANADGATSAGFGTTSEFHYLHHHGYAGKFIVAPVENQHEQGANAAELKGLCRSGDVLRADGIEQVRNRLDNLVNARMIESSSPLTGTMESILGAAARKAKPDEASVSNDDHAARLVADKPEAMSANAQHAIAAMAHYDATDAPKERRRAYKLIVPALDALITDPTATAPGIEKQAPTLQGDFEVLASQKAGQPHKLTVHGAIDLMRKAAEVSTGGDAALKDLLQIEIKNVNVKQLLAGFADELEGLMKITEVSARSDAAKEVLNKLAQKDLALGW